MKIVRSLAIAAAVAVAAPSALALNVAVYGEMGQDIATHGHTVTVLSLAQLESGINSFDVLVMGHPSDGEGFSSAACTSVSNFLGAGRRVVTEWDAVFNLFSAVGANIYVNSPPQCSFFSGTVDRGSIVGTNTPVNITQPGSPLVAGLPNPIQLGGGSEFFYQVTGFNISIWTVVATYDGWGATGNAAIMSACLGPGTVVVGVFDYGDVLPGNATSSTMLNNFITQPVGCTGILALPSTIPTLSEWAMLVLAGLLLAVGAVALRRRTTRR